MGLVGGQAGCRGKPAETEKCLLRKSKAFECVAIWLLFILSLPRNLFAATKHFDFNIAVVNFTRNCATKPILAVNGQFPGPTIHIFEGDEVVVKVTNNANSNVTIHWHGARMRVSNWQDGAGYITQCPIQPGDYQIYDFIVCDQRGTTFWHAHVNWARATLYGAFVTEPKNGYPFPKPHEEFSVILGEWWNGDVEAIERAGLAHGAAFPLADALTINGFPGSNYNCTESEGISIFYVEPGERYLLRIINAALNTDMFFGIANHELTVVEADSNYVKPFTVKTAVFIAVGQTLNVLVTANQPAGTYYIAGKGHSTLLTGTMDVIPESQASLLHNVPSIQTTAILQYKQIPVLAIGSTFFPVLPESNDEDYSRSFEKMLKSLYPEKVPSGSSNMRHLLYTVGSATRPCSSKSLCDPGRHGYRVAQAINNISFVLPTISILQAYYYGIPGVFSATFPDTPQYKYNYTATPSPPFSRQVAELGTRVTMVEYGTTVQLVLQNNGNFAFEAHPFHLHGFFFYVMGEGSGNFNATTDPMNYNYHDPPARFTVRSPRQGWVAIRFVADNPGAWLFHCHLEKHTSWGMQMVFIVQDGAAPHQSLAPPPRLNKC